MKPIHEEIEEFKKRLKTMSYYNAAEGGWAREYKDRQKAKVSLREIGTTLLGRDLSPEQIDEFVKQEGALVERSDWMIVCKK